MKKQFLFSCTVIISTVVVSCSKERAGKNQPAANSELQQSTSAGGIQERTVVDPLTVNLDGWFTFNNNLKDATKKLADGLPTTRAVTYTYDRHGIYHNAVKFNGTYGIKLFNVPQQTHGSVSLWVSCANLNYGTGRMILIPTSGGNGLGFSKTGSEIYGTVQSLSFGSLGILAGNVNNTWHHFVVTFDDVNLRIYKDGALTNTIPCGGTYPYTLQNYYLGYNQNPAEWFEGSVDDLRFYSRTLSANDVQLLYNQ